MSSKAQASMEFLLVYAWAILVVLVVVGTLAYFGVLNPEIIIPERCHLSQGFYCKDHILSAGDDELILQVRYGVGPDALLTEAYATNQRRGIYCENISLKDLTYGKNNGFYVKSGDLFEILLRCDPFDDDLAGSTKERFDLKLLWHRVDSETSYTHTAEGQLFAMIEE
ncbi:hypothetical protein JXB11_01360 [Candidatus Woesearchaeota archaeon]|nr:hypothetical protein [Candidatus Woesearchaeota archaeon]